MMLPQGQFVPNAEEIGHASVPSGHTSEINRRGAEEMPCCSEGCRRTQGWSNQLCTRSVPSSEAVGAAAASCWRDSDEVLGDSSSKAGRNNSAAFCNLRMDCSFIECQQSEIS